MTEKFISLKEAAEILGIQPGTLQKKCQGNPPEIAHYRIFGRPKFKLSEFMRYVERCRIEARPRLPRSQRRYSGTSAV